MKAIAKLIVVCVLLDAGFTERAHGGFEFLAHGARSATWAVGQTDGSESDRRQVASQWLKRARQSIKEGNLDEAEDFVGRAEQQGVKFESLLSQFSDSPTKVRRDIAAARKSSGKAAPPSQRFSPGSSNESGPQSAAAPPTRPGASDRAIESISDDARARAGRYLENGRHALKQGAINEAIAWRQKALATGATFAANEYSPTDLARELQQAGVDPNRLAASAAPGNPSRSGMGVPPNLVPEDVDQPAVSRLPAISDAGARSGLDPRNPPALMPPGEMRASGNSAALKDEAVRLASRALLALDKGDLATAKQLADQAESLRVPDSAFTANDIRPWQATLQVDSAITRRGGVVPAGFENPVPAVQNEPNRGGQFPVSNGLYVPNDDRTRNAYAQNQEPTPVLDPPAELPPKDSPGLHLYDEGLAALAAGNRDEAIRAFREAWKYQAELAPDVRQQLRDKLSLLTQAPGDAPRQPAQPSPLEEVNSQQQLVYQRLYREIVAEEQNAEKMTATDPKGALERLTSLRDRVNSEEMDAAARKQLLTFVDRSITRLETYIAQNKSEIELNERNRRIENEIQQGRIRKYEVDDTIASKVDEFNKLMEEERFAEAEVIARQVRELAPDSAIARTLVLTSTFKRRHIEQDRIRDEKEQRVYAALTDVDRSVKPWDESNLMEFGPVTEWQQLSKSRFQWLQDNERRMSPEELEIREALKKKVDVRFDNRPLKEVLDTLSSMTGVNIFLDASGLAAEGVTSNTPVSLNLTQPISLESALNLILQQMQLGYVIRNQVLHVTSEQAKDSHVYAKTYYVADLVVPIPNFVPSYNMGLPAAIREAYQALGYGGSYQPASGGPLAFVQNEDANVASSVLAQTNAYGKLPAKAGMRPAVPAGSFPGSMGGAALADFDTLIELITQTIAPDTWADAGGSGAIEPFPTNLSLVISQTQDVHDQIADLLEQLRRLQDLQVAIEVRFITLSDNFFERIGIDFDFEIDDNVDFLRRDDEGPSMAIGLDTGGEPTPDLDIPFSQDSFTLSIPTFGGFNPANAATLGVAILSDIEAFFLVQAAQGDNRSNVLIAPKVTLFNGQAASVADTSARPFVIGLIPVVGDFAVAHQPVVTVLNEGTQLGVQAVVSSDRRFVRLTLVPVFSQIGDVEEFTFSGSTSTDTGTNVVDPNGDPTGDRDNVTSVRTGTTIQLPTFAFTTVSTTVSVPDGGTVLLGGIKRLREGRNEYGVPGLSKLPYVNRLFKNVGIGRETTSLMLMVTPRIIIQEEEESKLGLNLGQ